MSMFSPISRILSTLPVIKPGFQIPIAKPVFTIPIQGKPTTGSLSSYHTVYWIGAPSSKDIKAKKPYHFVDAARSRGLDANTLCLVEKTGYEKAGISLGNVKAKLAPASVQCLTRTEALGIWLQLRTAHSKCRIIPLGHDLPAQ